jgi:hypothetical protein
MTFTYVPTTSHTKKPTEIDPEKLRHRYFVQLAPDGAHLVPGMLKQAGKPATGRWLELGRFHQSLVKRYFVQYLDEHTLVPGSLVQAERLPEGQWKEVKRRARDFYRIVFDEPWVVQTPPPSMIPDPTIYLNLAFDLPFFLSNIVSPVMQTIYPGVDPYHPLRTVTMYYFNGTFDQLHFDESKLTLFGLSKFFMVVDLGLTVFTSDFPLIDELSPFPRDDEYYLTVTDYTPDDYYSWVMRILNPQTGDYDYIFLENIVHKTTV